MRTRRCQHACHSGHNERQKSHGGSPLCSFSTTRPNNAPIHGSAPSLGRAMKLVPFVLEEWLAKYRDSVPHHLGMSTGPKWTLAELRALMTDGEREGFDRAALTYCPSNGREPLRAALASIYGAEAEEIVVFNGGAEALLALFFVAGEAGANVVVPTPAFAPFMEVPRSLGVEARRYELRLEKDFALDVDEVTRLVDARTKLIMVNTPHNPSGA